MATDLCSPGHGIVRYVPERKLRRSSRFPETLRSSRRGFRLGYPNKMAECSFPSRTMWCLRWCLPCRTYHQQVRLPMDHNLCSDAHECYHLHLILCKSSTCPNAKPTSNQICRPTLWSSLSLDKPWKVYHGVSSLLTPLPMLPRSCPLPFVVLVQRPCR
jgi:hypothetical protein